MKPVLCREGALLLFWCPGCDRAHGVTAEGSHAWGWNESMERPTFTPSVLVSGAAWESWRCHSFVTDGEIRFLGDSTHDLAGATVPLPAWPEGAE